jgi:hypothetical protein
MVTSLFEFLDIRTLSLVVGGTMLVSTISMTGHLFHRRTYGNFKLWTLGMGCLSLGFLLFSVRGFFFTYAVPSLNVRTSFVSFAGAIHFFLCAKILGTGVRDIR